MDFFANYFRITPVRAEAAEEEELVDPQVVLREKCGVKCEKYKEKLESCNDRVSSKSQTTEICAEELIDFMHCVDHCSAHDLFAKLK